MQGLSEYMFFVCFVFIFQFVSVSRIVLKCNKNDNVSVYDKSVNIILSTTQSVFVSRHLCITIDLKVTLKILHPLQ